MATDFSKSVLIDGGVLPKGTDIPGDIRTRIETIGDMESIPTPFIGMIVYVKDENKFYKVKTLKDKKQGLIVKPNAMVDTYEDLVSEGAATTFTPPTNSSTSDLGGVTAGEDLTGLTMQQVLAKLLYPYIKPSLQASLVCTPEDKILEKGYTVTVAKIRTTIAKGSETITKVSFLINNVESHILTENVSTGGTFEYTLTEPILIQTDLPTGYFKVAVTDAKNETVAVNIDTAVFVYPFYFGAVDENIEVNSNIVNGLSKIIDIKNDKEFVYSTNSQHMAIAYPKNHGDLVSIIDANGFNIINSFEKQEVAVDCFDGTTQSYLVYKNGASTVSNYKITFKF